MITNSVIKMIEIRIGDMTTEIVETIMEEEMIKEITMIEIIDGIIIKGKDTNQLGIIWTEGNRNERHSCHSLVGTSGRSSHTNSRHSYNSDRS